MSKLWRTSWAQFVSFLDYDHEVRTVIYTTNIIESLNARFRQVARRRGHFPTKQAAMKVLHLVVQQKRKSGGSMHTKLPTDLLTRPALRPLDTDETARVRTLLELAGLL